MGRDIFLFSGAVEVEWQVSLHAFSRDSIHTISQQNLQDTIHLRTILIPQSHCRYVGLHNTKDNENSSNTNS